METKAPAAQKLSPWLQISTRPGWVLGQLVARRDTQYMHRLMLLWSVSLMAALMLPSWLDTQQPPHPLEPLIQMLVIAPFAGLIAGYTVGGALKSVSGWLGAKHTTNDLMRMVHAWSLLPGILSRLVGMVAYVALRPEGDAMWIIYSIWIAGFLWSAILRTIGISKAVKPAATSGIAVHLIAYLLVLVPLGFLAVVYVLVLKTALHIQ